MFLRLSEADRAEFVKNHHATAFAPMDGRPMREYLVIPASIMENNQLLDTWLERSLQYAASLPPKAPRKKK
jgi:TfoX/Sxy family transcriptional regulator of competence genes